MAKHGVEIRRYLAWRKKVRGKTIPVRLHEIVYVGLVMLWSKMGKPPLSRAINEYINRAEYKKELMSGDLFKKLITEIKETPCEDKTGYYLANSRETLSQKDLVQLGKEKESILAGMVRLRLQFNISESNSTNLVTYSIQELLSLVCVTLLPQGIHRLPKPLIGWRSKLTQLMVMVGQ